MFVYAYTMPAASSLRPLKSTHTGLRSCAPAAPPFTRDVGHTPRTRGQRLAMSETCTGLSTHGKHAWPDGRRPLGSRRVKTARECVSKCQCIPALGELTVQRSAGRTALCEIASSSRGRVRHIYSLLNVYQRKVEKRPPKTHRAWCQPPRRRSAANAAYPGRYPVPQWDEPKLRENARDDSTVSNHVVRKSHCTCTSRTLTHLPHAARTAAFAINCPTSLSANPG
ncbi:hypothetical protein K466DRAFT_50719 [Polyporus arcularius HHB13444]|uniref:Uncharacterized protein n=1 Tax=Polyporus arcularius HHB13444 TaxID=1314778 RepID=A0A5C3NMK0_9APHY|nr:hypothetical protein K466DRAFT_50719 [Polyporus arcularius HHB13444]